MPMVRPSDFAQPMDNGVLDEGLQGEIGTSTFSVSRPISSEIDQRSAKRVFTTSR
jgi:hypothetical protein